VNKMIKKLAVLAITTTLILTAFSGISSAARKGFDPKKVGGRVVLTSFSDAVTMVPLRASDSASNDIQGNIFDSMVHQDITGQPIPGLAERWDYDDKTLTYTFYLRKGVKFHDGTPFTAKDVKFSFEMYSHPDTLNSYKADFADIKSITIVNDFTVKFVLKQRNVFFLTSAANSGAIMPAHLFPRGILDYNADNTAFSRKPIGTGPFKMKEWKTDERVVLVANKDYWDGRPYLDEVVTRILPDANVEAINLLKGDVDFVQSITPRTISQVEKDPDLKTVVYDYGRFDYIGWNNYNPLFKDKKVRQAMNYAMDRQALVSKVFLGRAYVGTGPFHPKLPQQNPDVKPYPFDLKKAAQLLADAGWKKGDGGILEKDGKKFEVEISYNNGNVVRQKMAQILAQNLKVLGIKATVRGYEWSLYLDKYKKGTLDMFVLAWGGYDANVEHYGFFHSSAIPTDTNAGNNRMRVNIPRVDKILELYLQEPDAAKRIKLYQEMHAILQEEAVMIFTHHPKITAGMDKNLLGVKISMSTPYWNVYDWYWKK
jgi:peptide/nickel transport system substrate-binding protein